MPRISTISSAPAKAYGLTAGTEGYKISRSLRFNSVDTAYLSRTPVNAGNRNTWTWSGWVKRAKLGTSQVLFQAGTASSPNETGITFPSGGGETDTLRVDINGNSIGIGGKVVTSALFRDTSAWYHVVLRVDLTEATSTDRVKIYVNGVLQASTATNPSNFNTTNSTQVNNNVAHAIGSNSFATGNLADYYLTEINFIDGQALTSDSFGYTDPTTGAWMPKKYTGAYGTNGFYLNFSDNSSLTTASNVGIGKDFSGNGNYWATNGLSVTAGAGNDSLLDSPTNSGASGNYATWNPLASDSNFSLSNGNTTITMADGKRCLGSMGVSTGKWYWEVTTNVSGALPLTGVTAVNFLVSSIHGSTQTSYFGTDVYKNFTDSSSTGTTQYTNGTYGFALNLDSGELKIYKNGALDRTDSTIPSDGSLVLFPVCWTTAGYGSGTTDINFGQRPFAYTVPTGFKALCTANLSTPVIKKPSNYMDVVTYTGNATIRNITGLNFSPDLVWIKDRTAANSHAIFDSTRGAGNGLRSDSNSGQLVDAESLTGFLNNGFSLGDNTPAISNVVNANTNNYVAWCYRTAIAGMNIVSYTGNSTARTISHGLGVAPKMIIIKAYGSGQTQNWSVYHSSIGNTKGIYLNLTSAGTTSSGFWNNTSPTASLFSVGGSPNAGYDDVNYTGFSYIAYLFAEVEGFSKFGSYTGNGGSDGPFVWCGFRPRYVMTKSSTATNNWTIYDTARATYNGALARLVANGPTAAAEADGLQLDINSNGFKWREGGGQGNDSGATYIFAAFAESPFKYSRAR